MYGIILFRKESIRHATNVFVWCIFKRTEQAEPEGARDVELEARWHQLRHCQSIAIAGTRSIPFNSIH